MSAQIASRPARSKGPRALGLLELAPNGVAHLIPVTIMYDGQFYDASAYKASPVPMALDSETVYEAVKTGVSLGLFTVTGAGQIKGSWIGQGIWRPARLGAEEEDRRDQETRRGRFRQTSGVAARRFENRKPARAIFLSICYASFAASALVCTSAGFRSSTGSGSAFSSEQH